MPVAGAARKGHLDPRLFASLLRRERRGASRVYTLLGERLFLGERTRYLNLGWWEGARSHDEAGDALAEQLGLAAGMREGDSVLDVGFGFGDQDAYWLQRFRPARIIGINVTPLHVECARRRFVDPRLEFRLGSATALDLPPAAVDRVTALECAFHFATRADFFAEAFRVLHPGGGLAAADVIPSRGRAPVAARLATAALRAFWQIPRENWYGIEAYRERLAAAGFVDVDVRSVRERVLLPFREATARLVRDPSAGERWSPLVRLAMQAPRSWLDGIDYVLASARKP